MLDRVIAYVTVHSRDIIIVCAFIVVAIWLEWLTMGRFWRAFFKRR